jgi:hypothetical protein
MPNNTGITSSNNPVELQRGAAPGIASESSPLDPEYRNLLENLRQGFPQTENLPLGKDEPGLRTKAETQNPLAQALQNIHREDDSFLETKETNQASKDQEELAETRAKLHKLSAEAMGLGLPEDEQIADSKGFLYPDKSAARNQIIFSQFIIALRKFFIDTHDSTPWTKMFAGKGKNPSYEETKKIQDRLFGNEQNINQGQ